MSDRNRTRHRSLRRAERGVAVASLLAILALTGCRTLDRTPHKVASFAPPPPASGALAEVTTGLKAQHGDEACGFLPIGSNREALDWRLALVDSAQHTIDAKYFIWHGDSAMLLLDRMVKAADRGVRVRLLIDDLHLAEKDRGVALLNTHPNIQVRVYNPWNVRDGGWVSRVIEGAMHFDEINHRMHNKLFAADNHLAIVGGRNVGDEYFGLSEAYNFRDFDLLVAGPVVPVLSRSFDDYWNSSLAYPGDQMIGSIDADDLPKVYEILDRALKERGGRLQSFSIAPRDWSDELAALPERMFTGTARVIYDEAPDEEGEREGEMIHELRRFIKQAREEVLLSTPYLVVDDSPMHSMRGIIDRGVKVKLLTNSLASIESELPYSGYRKDRKDILGTGLDLYELRADAASHDLSDTPPVEAQWLALHAKLIIVDREQLYVGTFNIDPRSAYLNSEMGLLIHAPELAQAVAAILDRDMGPDNAWRVRLDENGREYWESSAGRTYDAPSRGFDQNLADFFFGLLPIEDQL